MSTEVLRTQATRGPSPGRTSEPSVDASHTFTLDELRAQVQETLAERIEERQVGEPVQVVRKHALVAFNRLIRAEPDRLGVREDAPTLFRAQDVGEEESARYVRDFEALDGRRVSSSERDRTGS